MWYDSEKKIHDKKINNDDVSTSENPSLFSAIDLILEYYRNFDFFIDRKNYLYNHAIRVLRSPDSFRKWRRHSQGTFGEHFSFDEMLGVYLYSFPQNVSELPLWWEVDGKSYIRTESIFFLAVKCKILMYFLIIPYFLPSMLISLKRVPKHMGGAQKWFVRCFMMPRWFYSFTTWTLNKFGYTWYDVFYEYYSTYNSNPDEHPIVAKSKPILQ